jgi:hypothetical protein
MSTQVSGLDTLQDIRKMMEKSSRFISLSGWSGIAAGSSALAGAWLALERIRLYYDNEYGTSSRCIDCLKADLIKIAAGIFIAALVGAFIFTFIRSKKEGVAIWGNCARRLLWNTLLPMLAGGIFVLRLIQHQQYDLIASSSLIFYGLALVNGSRYTLGEIMYLGYAEIITGLVCLWLPRYGIYCWAFGFGFLHIVYGVAMWWKYERNTLTG